MLFSNPSVGMVLGQICREGECLYFRAEVPAEICFVYENVRERNHSRVAILPFVDGLRHKHVMPIIRERMRAKDVIVTIAMVVHQQTRNWQALLGIVGSIERCPVEVWGVI